MDSETPTIAGTEGARLQLLSSLARDKSFLREIAGLIKPEYFDQELHALAAETILEFWTRKKALLSRVDLVEGLASRLQKASNLKPGADRQRYILRPVEELIGKVWNVPVADGAGIRDKALDFCKRKALTLALYEAQENLSNPEFDPDSIQGILHNTFKRVTSEQDRGINFFPDTEDLPLRVTKMTQRKIPTGFKSLDRWMGGGMAAGTETVIMAPPKAGKTTTLINMSIRSLLKGKKVIYFTHEIGEAGIELRYTSRISGVNLRDIERDPKAMRKAVRARAMFWATHKPDLFIKGYPTKTCTPEMMKRYLYWLEGEYKFRPDLIVIDYADIVRSSKQFSADSERLIQADVYEQLRAMAQDLDAPLLTASQCNRASVNKPLINIEDLAESFSKAAIADHLIAVCSTPRERSRAMFRLHYASSREGESGHAVRCLRDFRRCYMEEMEPLTPEEMEKDSNKEE